MSFKLPNLNTLKFLRIFRFWSYCPNITFIITISTKKSIVRNIWQLCNTIDMILMYQIKLTNWIIFFNKHFIQNLPILILIIITNFTFFHCFKVIILLIILVHLFKQFIVNIFYVFSIIWRHYAFVIHVFYFILFFRWYLIFHFIGFNIYL